MAVRVGFVLLYLSHALLCAGQLSEPITKDSQIFDDSNKFLQRNVVADDHNMPPLDEESKSNTECPSHVELRWQTEVSSSIYSTPVIADINGDGKAEIVVPSFVHYLEVLEGVDGEKLPGWPSFHKSSAHTSPLVYDDDGDGMKEILLATYNGEILYFKHTGELLTDKRLLVPRLRVKKDWFEGLDADHVDHRHPDINATIVDGGMPNDVLPPGSTGNDRDVPLEPRLNLPHIANKTKAVLPKPDPACTDDLCTPKLAGGTPVVPLPAGNDTGAATDPALLPPPAGTDMAGQESVRPPPPPPLLESLLPLPKETGEGAEEAWQKWHDGVMAVGNGMSAEDKAKWDVFLSWKQDQEEKKKVVPEAPGGGGAVERGARRRRLMQAQEQVEGGEKVPGVEMSGGAMDEEASASWNVFADEDASNDPGLLDEYQYEYDEEVNGDLWADEDWTETEHEAEKEFIGIDAHILCTPVIADIDKDGVDELVVAASYFFDREYYDDAEHAKELEAGVDMSKYIGGAIVVYDLEMRRMKWYQHLDLTTDSTQFRAYIYSAPTVVDLDGDGYLEIVVGTSVGFIYALNHYGQSPHPPHTIPPSRAKNPFLIHHIDEGVAGKVLEGFPIQMGEIQGQVIAADINDDGEVEIVAGDTRGNVAAFSITAKEVWERHTGSLIAQGATVGDVNGDGRTEVVITSTGGHIWVLDGRTGKDVGGFPFRTHGRVMVPALLVDLTPGRGSGRKGLHIVVLSFDGYLYIVDGRTGCADAIDVGETSYSMVLADQVDGGDDLDLIVSTMNGNVYCFQTPATYHPLKAWSSQNQARNVHFPRLGREGIFFLPGSRQFRDVGTESFSVSFEVVDSRPIPSAQKGPYHVTMWLMTQEGKRAVHRANYTQPGVYLVRIRCPHVRTGASIMVEMLDEHKSYFSDEFSMSFHMHFYRIIKWILVLPLVAMLSALVLRSSPESLRRQALPSFSSSRHKS